MCWVLNVPEFWILENFRKYDSVLNMLGCNYRRFLNIPGFQVCQVSTYVSIVQGSEYAWIWLNNALWQCFEYAWSMLHKVFNKPPVPREELGHFDKHLVKNASKKGTTGEHFGIFSLKTIFLMENLTQRWTQSGPFSKRAGGGLPSPP